MAYADTFTGTNGTSLSAYNAVWVNVVGTLIIQSNAVTGADGDNFECYYYNQTAATKHYAKLQLTAEGSAGGRAIGPAIRVQSSGVNFYYCLVDNTNVYNGEMVAGSSTDWDSGLDNGAVNDVHELAVDGSTEGTVYYKRNGSTIATYTSKTNLTGGRFGVCGYTAGAPDQLGDNWEGGDVGGVVATRKFQRASILGV